MLPGGTHNARTPSAYSARVPGANRCSRSSLATCSESASREHVERRRVLDLLRELSRGGKAEHRMNSRLRLEGRADPTKNIHKIGRRSHRDLGFRRRAARGALAYTASKAMAAVPAQAL